MTQGHQCHRKRLFCFKKLSNENDMLENIDIDVINNDFISQNI